MSEPAYACAPTLGLPVSTRPRAHGQPLPAGRAQASNPILRVARPSSPTRHLAEIPETHAPSQARILRVRRRGARPLARRGRGGAAGAAPARLLVGGDARGDV